ncbi:MAG TPA: hypothetical protein VE218_06210, partial [Acidobacteriaceae bacterium]|nr:hypothetical protein [Acidobacteriaceae bacterium]
MAETTQDLHQSLEAVLAVFESKRQRLCERMASSGLAAVQLQLTENLAWLTAGRVDHRVLLPS